MPLGLIFGALFCAGFSCWLGARLVAQPGAAASAAGVCLAVCGLSLALGLLRRRRWARSGAVILACVFAWVGLRLSGQGDELTDYLLFLSALAAVVLLVLPATGDPQRGAALPPGPGLRSKSLGVAAVVGALGTLGFAAVWWTSAGLAAGGGPGRPAAPLPAAALAAQVQIEWSPGFAGGMARARAAGRPLLVTFFTDWCAYCKKMASTTWKSPTVAQRMREVVAVRLNAEDGGEGSELAQRFGVQGFPMQVLLDPQGRVLARADGYQSSTELMAWLDRALGPAGSAAGNPIQTR